VKPSWPAVEAARVEEQLPVERAVRILGMSRTSYYRHVRGMVDYQRRKRASASSQHRETLREVALKRPEAGHRKVRAYAVAWKRLSQREAGTSRMSCYRVLKAQGLIQPGRLGVHLKEIRDRRRQLLEVPTKLNQVLQCDFTDYETEDGQTYRIGCVTEYLSRFNLVSMVLDTETAADLIRVTEAALEEIGRCQHEFPSRIVVVTDNGPAMKSHRFRKFIEKHDRLDHIRGQKYHPQTIGREERYHGSLKLEWLYRYLPKNRSELVDQVAAYRAFYNHERVHESLEYRTPASVYLINMAAGSSYLTVG
jgi:putative transposase